MTTLYALGLYSLFLSQNIFTVSSIRTIALLSGARTVSLVLTLLSYFFISNVVFSFHINFFITLIIIFLYTFPLVLQSIWVHTLEKKVFAHIFLLFYLYSLSGSRSVVYTPRFFFYTDFKLTRSSRWATECAPSSPERQDIQGAT